MRIYVAGAWADRSRVSDVARFLSDLRHEIALSWWVFPDTEDPAALAQAGDMELDAIRRSDAAVVVAHPAMRGGWLETGYALGLGLRVVVLDDGDGYVARMPFCHLPQVTVVTDLVGLRDALASLGGRAGR